MRVLLIHGETRYFGGAEVMLYHFAEELARRHQEVAVAVVPGSRTAGGLPAAVPKVWISGRSRFSIWTLISQTKLLGRVVEAQDCQVVHGWTARDWELTSLVARLNRRPAVGTLHDHPRALFISARRRRLMRISSRWGLDRIVCVSRAVAAACLEAGYNPRKLQTIHNGLPSAPWTPVRREPGPVRLGFLGILSERKGLRGLFAILEALAEYGKLEPRWEVWIGGEAQDAAGRALSAEVRAAFGACAWWKQVRWCGWVKKPLEFMQGLDLLIVSSTEFDPFPTVLLEAGLAGIPVIATRVGGVMEIVEEGQTGWVFDPGQWKQAADVLRRVINEPDRLARAGVAAAKRVRERFTIEKMVADYLELYSSLARDG